MSKKKILHIAEAWGSGVFSFIVDLVNGTSDDYEIVIAHGIREETFSNYKDYFPSNVKLIEVKNFTRSINPIKDIKAFFELRKIIKLENPDIVHLHSSKAGFIGRFACNTKKRKVLYNPHGFSFLMQDSSKLKRLIYLLIEKFATLKKCTIIGCSKGEYKEALKLTKNAVCIDNGVDIKKLEIETKNFSEKNIDWENLNICTIGRIGNQKNPELFNNISKNFSNYKFTWIGSGDMKDKLTSSNIKVTGWKSKKEVLEILNQNDVFILTSLWEGLPLSLLEAMYLKKVCIVSDCIGNRDVIIDGKNGCVCKNLEEFCKTIKSLNKMDLSSLKQNAYKDIENNYNTINMISKYKEIY